jgi:hypothetical protein
LSMHVDGQTDDSCHWRSAQMQMLQKGDERSENVREGRKKRMSWRERAACHLDMSAFVIDRTFNWLSWWTWPYETLALRDLEPCNGRVWECFVQARAAHFRMDSVFFLPSFYCYR